MINLLTIALCLAAKPGPHIRFALYGDCRDGHAVHRQIIQQILKSKAEFVLQTGDLVHRGADTSLWKIYDQIVAPLKGKVAIYPARGNHDLGGEGYFQRVPQTSSGKDKLYYSFDKANCHFIALAVDEQTTFDAKSAQYRWLQKDLAAHALGKHTFVYFHLPPYSIGHHGSSLDVRAALCPLFSRYRVEQVFNGHDHIYYRTKRNGIMYTVAGGGGAHLYECDPAKGAIAGDKWESTYNLIIFDVQGDSVYAKAIRPDGSLIERFTTHLRKS